MFRCSQIGTAVLAIGIHHLVLRHLLRERGPGDHGLPDRS
jgi:hypothetical protein